MGKSFINTAVIAGAVGAAAGATAVALSDKNNRKKLGKVVANVTHRAQEIATDLRKGSKPVIKAAKEVSSDIAEDAKKSKTIRRARESIKSAL